MERRSATITSPIAGFLRSCLIRRPWNARRSPVSRLGKFTVDMSCSPIPGSRLEQSLALIWRSGRRRRRDRLKRATTRPILVRPKGCVRALATDLSGAWALVTHSSNVAVDAVLSGVPVFVAETSPAAPVGRIGFDEIENPVRPGRRAWIASLACQQFTIGEMRNGTAYRCLAAVRELAETKRCSRT